MTVNICKGTDPNSYDSTYTWKVTGNSGCSLSGECSTRWRRRKEIKQAVWQLGLIARCRPAIEEMVRSEVLQQLNDWHGPASILRRQLADTVQHLHEHTQQPHKKVEVKK